MTHTLSSWGPGVSFGENKREDYVHIWWCVQKPSHWTHKQKGQNDGISAIALPPHTSERWVFTHSATSKPTGSSRRDPINIMGIKQDKCLLLPSFPPLSSSTDPSAQGWISLEESDAFNMTATLQPKNPALNAMGDWSWKAFVYLLISIFFLETESTKESLQIIKHPNSGLSLINEEEGVVCQEPRNAGLRLCHNWSLLFPAEVYLSHFLMIVSFQLLIN